MEIYKNFNRHYAVSYALPHIKANKIQCRKYGWCGMCGNIDRLKIDGKDRFFRIDNHLEVKSYSG